MQDDSNPPAVLELMRAFAEDANADGVTLWKEESGNLVATANPLEPDIVGMRQPLGSGLISRVYLTGQAILEEELPSHPSHDPVIDRRLGRKCRAMMAAPVEAGENGGVVSAVIFEDSPGGFSLKNLGELADLAGKIGKPAGKGK